jgi:hypothetical protein
LSIIFWSFWGGVLWKICLNVGREDDHLLSHANGWLCERLLEGTKLSNMIQSGLKPTSFGRVSSTRKNHPSISFVLGLTNY